MTTADCGIPSGKRRRLRTKKKVEDGQERTNKEYNSFELFNSLSTMVIPRIGDKPIDFKTVIASDIPPVLKGDTGKLKQIILS